MMGTRQKESRLFCLAYSCFFKDQAQAAEVSGKDISFPEPFPRKIDSEELLGYFQYTNRIMELVL